METTYKKVGDKLIVTRQIEVIETYSLDDLFLQEESLATRLAEVRAKITSAQQAGMTSTPVLEDAAAEITPE